MTESSPTASQAPAGQPVTPPPQSSVRNLWRWLLWSVLILVLCAVLLLLAGGWYLQRWLQVQGIEELDIQVQSWALDHLILEQLAFVRSTSKERQGLVVQARTVHLGWQWQGGWLPRLGAVEVQQLQVTVESGAASGEAWGADGKLAPRDWSVPGWLPRQISVDQLQVVLPCADGHCQLSGTAQFSVKEQITSLQIRLFHLDHEVTANLQGMMGEHATWQAEVELDGLPVVQGQGSFQQAPHDMTSMQGHLRVQSGIAQPWLLEWLAQWQPRLREATALQSLPAMEVRGTWDLQLPAQLGPGGLQQALTGRLALAGQLAPGGSVPLVELTGGELALDLEVREGQLSRYQLQAEGRLARLPGVEFLQQFEGLDPGPVQVRLRSQGDWRGLAETRPLVELWLESLGELSGEGRAGVVVSLTAPFAAEVRESWLRLQSPLVSFTPQVRLQNATLELQAQGHWRQEDYRVEFKPTSWLSAERLELPELALEQARLEPAQFVIEGGGGMSRLQSQLNLVTSRLIQEQLYPQSWQAQGRLEYGQGGLSVQGQAQAQSGLAIEYGFQHRPDQPMELDWAVDSLYFLAANPLPAILKPWPELLEISRGKLSAQGRVVFPWEDEALALNAELHLRDLGGIYDRMLIDGLSADLLFQMQGEQVKVTSQSMQVERLNAGLDLGPLWIEGSYASTSGDLSQGMVALRRLELGLLGGRVWTEPVHFDLTDKPVPLPLLIRGVDLSRILELYATRDLSGQGTLDGNLPLMISRQGVSMAEGNLHARPPGGVLRYSQGLAVNDARMELLAEVLENFHYSLLSSEITYEDDGQLKLGVRLQGKNPQMRESPPVHLNINLEENLPMLLASLQMASNLSDTVKNRVSEALRKRQATKSP